MMAFIGRVTIFVGLLVGLTFLAVLFRHATGWSADFVVGWTMASVAQLLWPGWFWPSAHLTPPRGER